MLPVGRTRRLQGCLRRGHSGRKIAPGVINIDGSAYQVFDLPEDGLNLGAGPFTPDGTRIAFEGFDPTDPAVDGIYTGSATDGSGLRGSPISTTSPATSRPTVRGWPSTDRLRTRTQAH